MIKNWLKDWFKNKKSTDWLLPVSAWGRCWSGTCTFQSRSSAHCWRVASTCYDRCEWRTDDCCAPPGECEWRGSPSSQTWSTPPATDNTPPLVSNLYPDVGISGEFQPQNIWGEIFKARSLLLVEGGESVEAAGRVGTGWLR